MGGEGFGPLGGEGFALPPLAPVGFALPPPLDVHVTRWGADPYSLGSYSYDRVGCEQRHRAVLRAPEGGSAESVPRLFFAGEAASVDAPQCVHGALETGEEAAAELLRCAPPVWRSVCAPRER